jgi:hypothetical protein
MPAVMTLDGAGRRGRLNLFGFGDAWSEDEAAAGGVAATPLETLTTSFVSWGILAFAVATVGLRVRDAIKRR